MNDISKFQVRRPEVGRPDDKRVTAEFLALRPELKGLKPFNKDGDIDLVDEINNALNNLHALVAYADPELGTQVKASLADIQKSLADTAQATARANAAADAISAMGMRYIETASDGAAVIDVLDTAAATLSTERTDWPLIGPLDGPVLTIGGQ